MAPGCHPVPAQSSAGPSLLDQNPVQQMRCTTPRLHPYYNSCPGAWSLCYNTVRPVYQKHGWDCNAVRAVDREYGFQVVVQLG